jgi:hypothetical protein
VFDDLVKFGQLGFLIFIELFHDEFLRIGAVVHLLLELFDGGLHPMFVIFSRRDVLLLQLLLDVSPDLAHFEVRIHLNHFQFLLLISIEVISGESHSIQNRKYDQSDIILLDLLSDPIHQISLCSGFSQIFQVCRLWQVFLD